MGECHLSVASRVEDSLNYRSLFVFRLLWRSKSLFSQSCLEAGSFPLSSPRPLFLEEVQHEGCGGEVFHVLLFLSHSNLLDVDGVVDCSSTEDLAEFVSVFV